MFPKFNYPSHSFRGRVGRGDFGVVVAFLGLSWAVTWLLIATNGWNPPNGGPRSAGFYTVLSVVNLMSPIYLSAYSVRRVRDLGRPAWQALPFIFSLAALVVLWTGHGQAMLKTAGPDASNAVSILLTCVLIAVIAAFLGVMLAKGVAGPTKDGPEPQDLLLPMLLCISGLHQR